MNPINPVALYQIYQIQIVDLPPLLDSSISLEYSGDIGEPWNVMKDLQTAEISA